MDGQRAVFERGMLAQHLLLFRELARSKRYMNMPRSLALCGKGLAPDRAVSATHVSTESRLSGAIPLPHLNPIVNQIGLGQSMNRCSRAKRRAR
ncbi:hypothetical protein CQ048_21495 [Pseudomonas trivialis]|nr:hypothetical protein CQ048_21495 [Pseudomonas trivialis]PRB22995.1 hypothetical protein CQ041_21325 [Pseudomonas sp. MYb60]